MRPLEYLLSITVLIQILLFYLPSKRRFLFYKVFNALSLFVILMHVVFEYPRIQMMFLYILGVILFILNLTIKVNSRKWIIFIISVFVICTYAISIFLTSFLPVNKLPKPTGKYIVGNTELYLKDDSRNEWNSSNRENRELAINIWYPSDSLLTTIDNTPYVPDYYIEAFAKKTSLPKIFWSYLNLVKTHSYKNIPISDAEKSFPVIFFMHGYNCHPSDYTSLMDDLASHGFIIFSINITYQSCFTKLENGQIVNFKDNFVSVEDGMKFGQLKEEFNNSNSIQEKLDVIQKMNLSPQGTWNINKVDMWMEDLKFVKAELKDINNDSNNFLYGKLDLENCGIYGHSFGGTVGMNACAENFGINAGISLDGNALFLNRTIKKPFVFFDTDKPASGIDYSNLYDHFSQETYHVRINGAKHNSFSDGFELSTNGLSNNTVIEITNHYIVAFFKKYLKNEDGINLEDIGKEIDEVEYIEYIKNAP